MKFFVEFGGIRFRFDSDCDIIVENTFAPFLRTCEAAPDVHVRLIHDFSDAPLPRSPMLGDDLLMEYYDHNGRILCLTKGGEGRFLASCLCAPDLKEMTCWLNFPAGSPLDTLGGILRMLPMRRIMTLHGVLFFHASQIGLGDKGILFAAPSGTGKTTQAKLWRRHRGAQILCNDRTLTDGSLTYGYPMDGSEPVITGECRSLGAIVVLEQAPRNSVRALRPREILLHLMPQLVLDAGDPAAAAAAAELLLNLIPQTPVYLLRCTPDEYAVQCLEQQLFMDGVISHE